MAPVILVVESEDSVRAAVRQWVTQMFPEGRIVEAASGHQAVTRARTCAPNIVLLDVNLPGMSAGQTKRFIEASTPEAEVVLFSPEDAGAKPRQKAPSASHEPLQKQTGSWGTGSHDFEHICLN